MPQNPYDVDSLVRPVMPEDFVRPPELNDYSGGPSWGQSAISMGLRTIPAVAGGILGTPFGGPIGTAAGGAIGSALGSALGQWYEGNQGLRDEFSFPELGVETALGAIPMMGKVPKMGATGAEWLKYARQAPFRGAAEGAVIGGGSTIPMHIAQTGQWEMPSGEEFAANIGFGTLAGGATGYAFGTRPGMKNARTADINAQIPSPSPTPNVPQVQQVATGGGPNIVMDSNGFYVVPPGVNTPALREDMAQTGYFPVQVVPDGTVIYGPQGSIPPTQAAQPTPTVPIIQPPSTTIPPDQPIPSPIQENVTPFEGLRSPVMQDMPLQPTPRKFQRDFPLNQAEGGIPPFDLPITDTYTGRLEDISIQELDQMIDSDIPGVRSRALLELQRRNPGLDFDPSLLNDRSTPQAAPAPISQPNIFQRLMGEEEGTYKPGWLQRPERKPVHGDEQIPDLAFQPDEGVASQREFSEHFLPGDEARTDVRGVDPINPTSRKTINRETETAPEGIMNAIKTDYPNILEEARAIYNETDPRRISENLAHYTTEENKVMKIWNEAQNNRLRNKIPVPPEITAAYNRTTRLRNLARAVYERASTRQLESPGLFERFMREDEGTLDIEEMRRRFRLLRNSRLMPGEQTGRVAPFDRGFIPEESQGIYDTPTDPTKLQGFLDSDPFGAKPEVPPQDKWDVPTQKPRQVYEISKNLDDAIKAKNENTIDQLMAEAEQVIMKETDPEIIKDNYNQLEEELQYQHLHGDDNQIELFGTMRDFALDKYRQIGGDAWDQSANAETWNPREVTIGEAREGMDFWNEKFKKAADAGDIPGAREARLKLIEIEQLIAKLENRDAYGGLPPIKTEAMSKPRNIQPWDKAISPQEGQGELPWSRGEANMPIDADALARHRQAAADRLTRFGPDEPVQGSMEGQMKDAEIADYLRKNPEQLYQLDLPPEGTLRPIRGGESPKYKHPTAQNWAARVEELDAIKAPDIKYRDIMSTGSKNPLKRGQTWRGRVMNGIEYFESIMRDKEIADYLKREDAIPPEMRDITSYKNQPEVLPAEPELDIFGYPKDRDLTPEEVNRIKRQIMANESQYFGPDTVENQKTIDQMTGTIDADVIRSIRKEIEQAESEGLVVIPPGTRGYLANQPTIRTLSDGSRVIRPPSISGSSPSPNINSIARLAAQGIDEAYELSRGVLTTLDFSATLRQGLPLIGTKAWFNSWGKMFKAAGSEAGFNAVMNDIRQRPMFRREINTRTNRLENSMAENLGLDLTDMYGNREEMFMSRLLNRIGPVRATNRAYTAFLNHLRASTFEQLIVDAAQAAGNDITQNPFRNQALAKSIADYVNTATGRAPLRISLLGEAETSFEGTAKVLSKVMFSPKLLLSRGRMLSPGTYIQAPPFVRKQYLHSLARTAGAWMGFAGLASMIPGAEVSLDSNSADFGKVKIGNTRLDPGGGFQQFLVVFSRMASGKYTSSGTGREFELGQGYRAETRLSVGQRFLENKLHPTAKLGYDLLNATQYRPVYLGDRIAQMYVPMIVQDALEISRENPDIAPFLIGAAAFGMGTQTYEAGEVPNRFISKRNDLKLQGGALQLGR